MTDYKDNYFIDREDNKFVLRLIKCIPYFPWKEWCDSKDYAMPYPEIIALSDHAHAYYTQISGMLIDFTHTSKNRVEVDLKFKKSTNNKLSFRMGITPLLDDISEIWNAIEITNEKLMEYTALMVRNYLLDNLRTLGYVDMLELSCFEYDISIDYIR